ncbi:TylF/MycF family methyltransferase [Helicobacter jaachi]|uniref:TylF/MycF family methyltransferase n=1 Tax=Helicobacter jaachi TaxID=1677920 RepID=UPI001EE90300|nr:TylF/MycF family methyltransferase [Helicobacter jaachi]
MYNSLQLQNLDFDRIIIGTFTGLYEISAQLQSLGVPKEKIDTSYIEVSVKARENFVREFASEFLQNIESKATDSINTESSRQNYAIAEVGVYRGDFARVINEAFSKNRFYLFDTFEGFSMQDLGGNSNTKDGVMGANLGAKHFANTSVELVLSKMPNPKNCVIKKGWFPQSAQDCTDLDSKFCFVNLDCDLYEPILAGLKFFYPRMCEGGVILIHEYFSNGYVGVRAAVQEFFAKQNLKSFQKIPIGDNLSIAILKI